MRAWLLAFLAVILALAAPAPAEAQSPGRLRMAVGGGVATPPPDPDPGGATILFGAENWAGYGPDCSLGLAPGLAVSGPDAASGAFGQDANGCLIPFPALAYGSAAGTFAKSSYAYTFGATDVNFQIIPNARFVASRATDTSGNYELKNTLLRSYTLAGAVELGDEIWVRSGSVIGTTGTGWAIGSLTGQWKGAWSAITGGSGYTNGEHFDLAATCVSCAGSPTGLAINVHVVSGEVRQVHVIDWGTADYQEGDILTADVPGSGSQAGFTFTLSDRINGTAPILIRSEVPNTAMHQEGSDVPHPRKGGSARIEGLEFAGSGGLVPIKIRYMDLEWPHATAPTYGSAFIFYRDSSPNASTGWGRWGVSGSDNFISVTQLTAEGGFGRDGVQNRMGVWEDNHVFKVDNAFQMQGRAWTMQPRYTKTVSRRNLTHSLRIDCHKLIWTGHRVEDMFCYDWMLRTPEQGQPSHGDGIQILVANTGMLNPDVVIARRNIAVRNEGRVDGAGSGPQAVPITTNSGGQNEGTFEHNFLWSPALVGVSMSRFVNPFARFNMVLTNPDAPNYDGYQLLLNTVRFMFGEGGTMTHNVANDFSSTDQTGFTLDMSTNVELAVDLEAYDGAVVDGKYGRYSSRAAFLADKSPIPGGTLHIGGGVYAGPLFPACPGETIGAWNDATAWNCGDLTWRAAHPPAE